VKYAPLFSAPLGTGQPLAVEDIPRVIPLPISPATESCQPPTGKRFSRRRRYRHFDDTGRAGGVGDVYAGKAS